MTIAITGHEGYVGSVLVPELVKAGFSVRGFDRRLYDRAVFGPPTPVVVDSERKDVRDLTPADLAGCEAVVHLAGLSNDPLGDLSPELTFDINYRAAVHTAEVARQAGVGRFVFASSCSVYGDSDGSLLTEMSDLRPVTPYAESKVLAETGIHALATSRFHPMSLRFGTAFGHSPRIRFDLVINNLVAWAMNTGEVLLKSDGLAWRPFVHVLTMARAVEHLLRQPPPKPEGSILNVGTEAMNQTVSQVAAHVAGSVKGATLRTVDDAIVDHRHYRASFRRLEARVPGWNNMAVGIEDGILDLVRRFEEHPVGIEAVESGVFSRVRTVRRLLESGEVDHLLRIPERDRAESVR